VGDFLIYAKVWHIRKRKHTVNKKAHQAQSSAYNHFFEQCQLLVEYPAEKVVATIETPNSHQAYFFQKEKILLSGCFLLLE